MEALDAAGAGGEGDRQEAFVGVGAEAPGVGQAQRVQGLGQGLANQGRAAAREVGRTSAR